MSTLELGSDDKVLASLPLNWLLCSLLSHLASQPRLFFRQQFESVVSAAFYQQQDCEQRCDMKGEEQACGESLVLCFEVEEERGEERNKRRRRKEEDGENSTTENSRIVKSRQSH